MAKSFPGPSPIALREIKSRMRNGRAYAVLTVYMAVLSGIALFLYAGAVLGNPNNAIDSSTKVGAALFYVVVGLQIVLVSFVGPAFTAGAISGERERRTMDLLTVSLLTPRQIAVGKLASALGFILILVAATTPLFSLAFLLGGIETGQLAAALSVVVASATLFSTLGLFVSSRAPTTLSAAIITYAALLGIVIGMAVMATALFPVLDNATRAAAGGAASLSATVLSALFFVIISLSPISALVATEANFQNSGNLLTLAIGAPATATLPAPFLILCVAYLAASAMLFWLATRAIGR